MSVDTTEESEQNTYVRVERIELPRSPDTDGYPDRLPRLQVGLSKTLQGANADPSVFPDFLVGEPVSERHEKGDVLDLLGYMAAHGRRMRVGR